MQFRFNFDKDTKKYVVCCNNLEYYRLKLIRKLEIIYFNPHFFFFFLLRKERERNEARSSLYFLTGLILSLHLYFILISLKWSLLRAIDPNSHPHSQVEFQFFRLSGSTIPLLDRVWYAKVHFYMNRDSTRGVLARLVELKLPVFILQGRHTYPGYSEANEFL